MDRISEYCAHSIYFYDQPILVIALFRAEKSTIIHVVITIIMSYCVRSPLHVQRQVSPRTIGVFFLHVMKIERDVCDLWASVVFCYSPNAFVDEIWIIFSRCIVRTKKVWKNTFFFSVWPGVINCSACLIDHFFFFFYMSLQISCLVFLVFVCFLFFGRYERMVGKNFVRISYTVIHFRHRCPEREYHVILSMKNLKKITGHS